MMVNHQKNVSLIQSKKGFKSMRRFGLILLIAFVLTIVIYKFFILDNHYAQSPQLVEIDLNILSEKYSKCDNSSYRHDCYDDYNENSNRKAGYFANNQIYHGYVWQNSILTFEYLNGKKNAIISCSGPIDEWYYCPDGQRKRYLDEESKNSRGKEGKILVEFASGAVFEGNWENNVKHGYGKITWANGDVYEGNFKNNVRHGYGKMTMANGGVVEGEWIKGELQ